jgi:hypothetical protein
MIEAFAKIMFWFGIGLILYSQSQINDELTARVHALECATPGMEKKCSAP